MESSARYWCDKDEDEQALLLSISSNSQDSKQARREDATRAGITDSPEVYKSKWRSIRVMYLTMFLSSVSFSICMSSLYPYLRILDSKASTDFLGWVVASYSVGQLIASPFFGAWSNIRSRTREPLIVSVIINVLANILYMYLESIQKYAQIYLLIARALIGFGAGNIAVVRSYVAGATTLSERTPAMANLSAFQSLGFIFGNVLQTAMVPLGYPGPVNSPELHIDMYSATGLFSAIVGVVNILFIVFIFQEHVSNDDGNTHADCVRGTTSTLDNSQTVHSRDTTLDYLAVLLSVILFFAVLFIFAVLETIVTPLGMDMLAWKKAEATLYVGIMLGCAGLVSIVVFVIIKILAKIYNERCLLLGGFIICLLGYGFYLPWGHTYPGVQYAEIIKAGRTNNEISSISEIAAGHLKLDTILNKSKKLEEINDNIATESRTMFGKPHQSEGTFSDNRGIFKSVLHENSTEHGGSRVLNISVEMNRGIGNKPSVEAVGCPYFFKWCMYTPALFLWQYLLGTLFIAVGYPACSVMSYSIFSKVLGPKPQGVWMGWLTASGSLARALGPIFVSQVYDSYGPRVTFTAVIGIIILAITILLVVYKRLVPFGSASRVLHRT